MSVFRGTLLLLRRFVKSTTDLVERREQAIGNLPNRCLVDIVDVGSDAVLRLNRTVTAMPYDYDPKRHCMLNFA